MYKFFAFAFYFLPVIFVISIFSNKAGFLYKGSLYIFLLLVLLYILLPVTILFRALFQVKKESSIKTLIDKVYTKIHHVLVPSDLLSGLLKLFLILCVLFISFYASFGTFIWFIDKTFPSEISLVLNTFLHSDDYINKINNIDKQLSDMDKKLYEEKRADFYKNNSDILRYSGNIADFNMYNTVVIPDYPGFNNKYHYNFNFCFKDSYVKSVLSAYPDYSFSGCPFIYDENGQQAYDVDGKQNFDFVYLFQNDKIKDFYVDTYKVDKFKLPVFVGTVELENRDISFFAFPKSSEKSVYQYVFKNLPSAVNNLESEYCDFSSKTESTLTIVCSNRYPDKYAASGVNTKNAVYWTFSVNSNGDIEVNPSMQL